MPAVTSMHTCVTLDEISCLINVHCVESFYVMCNISNMPPIRNLSNFKVQCFMTYIN